MITEEIQPTQFAWQQSFDCRSLASILADYRTVNNEAPLGVLHTPASGCTAILGAPETGAAEQGELGGRGG